MAKCLDGPAQQPLKNRMLYPYIQMRPGGMREPDLAASDRCEFYSNAGSTQAMMRHSIALARSIEDVPLQSIRAVRDTRLRLRPGVGDMVCSVPGV